MNAPAGVPGIGLLDLDWTPPAGVRAAFTLRTGGVSQGPWTSLNLGTHVADEPAAVQENRRRVREQLGLPGEPWWLSQVHGAGVVEAGTVSPRTDPGDPPSAPPEADAIVTREPGRVLVIQVADCLPVLLTDHEGSVVAGAHAGWRGLAAGVLEATIAAMGVPPGGLQAWIGPGIGPAAFEVGDEVRAAFVEGTGSGDPGAADAFVRNHRGRWWCDLRQLAVRRLAAAGVAAVHGVDKGRAWCTHGDPARFFSHRRDGRCGRMAALIWRR